MKQLLFSIFCFLILLTGCSKQSSLIRYDILNAPRNLDPQFSTKETDQMIIHNLFEGLMYQLPNGAVEKALAESVVVSPDEKTYTFTLRKDALWHSEEPVTASDFVFAFHRIFNAVSPSPYSQLFLSIKNAPAIIDGRMDVSQLGVYALDEHTVVFELSQPDASFLEHLCHSSAMPCSRSFFEKTRGTYGTDRSTTPSNGAFFLNLWDESKLYLKKNPHYYAASEVQTPGVYLFIGRDLPSKEVPEPPTRFELMMDGMSDSCSATFEQAMQAKEKGYTSQEHVATVWGLVANPQHPQLSQESIRKAFFHSINRKTFEGYLTENMVLTHRIISPEISLFAQPYLESAPLPLPPYDPNAAHAELEQGMDSLGIRSLMPMELLVPEDSNIPFFSGMLQQAWQVNLSAFVNIVSLPREELMQRVQEKSYDLAIVPFTSNSNTPYDVLSQFAGQTKDAPWGISSAQYDSLLQIAHRSSDPAAVKKACLDAESLLYDDCIVFPLFYEISYVLFPPDVSGIEIYPYGGMVSFRNGIALR